MTTSSSEPQPGTPFTDTDDYWRLVEAQGRQDEDVLSKMSFPGPKGWEYSDFCWHYLFVQTLYEANELEAVTKVIDLHSITPSYEYRTYTDELQEFRYKNHRKE